MRHPNIQTLEAVISYDRDAGTFCWLERTPDMFEPKGQRNAEGCCANWNARYAGRPALTYIGTHGYYCGNLLGSVRLAHRVAMAIITGGWDFPYVDHINGDKLDNRAANLRTCSNAENLRNSKPRARGHSKYKGVSWNKKSQKWVAYICRDGRNTHLGCFDNEHDAAIAYNAASPDFHGQYGRLNIV